MLVRNLMTSDFETVARDASLYVAVETMLRSGTEYVVLTSDEEPDGLITQRKALIACYKTERALPEIPVSGFAVGFPTTIKPDATALLATGHLVKADVSVLPVVEGLELVGVVTREDLLDNSSNLRREVFEQDERRDDWEDEPNKP